MTRVLAGILAAKSAEVIDLRRQPVAVGATPRGDLVSKRLARPAPARPRIIAEIKRRSPSAGPLSTALSVGERAVAYAKAGATMISVLCDQPFFDGSWAHLDEARAALTAAGEDTLLLAKEFVLDERQLKEAAARGADAVLLIARIVDKSRLHELVFQARGLGLEPLVEVVTEDELHAAVDAGAAVIGVNARDLDTLVMDLGRAARVLSAIPDGDVAVHLSGVRAPPDLARIAETDVDAVLVGEALMRKDDPSALLAKFVRG